jgi:hypothetical protein
MRLTKKVELVWGTRFLSIYNTLCRTNFVIERQNENPDIDCRDIGSGLYLGLEIKRHGNLPGDVETDERLARGEDVSFSNSLGQRGNIDNIIQRLEVTLEKVRTTNYQGSNVALVIPTVTRMWDRHALINQFELLNFRWVVKEFETKFPAGIWFFCHGPHEGLDLIELTAL